MEFARLKAKDKITLILLIVFFLIGVQVNNLDTVTHVYVNYTDK